MLQPQSFSILIFEDNPGDVRLIQEYLGAVDLDLTLHVSDRLDLGIQLLKSTQVDIVLLDLGLPDSYGIETLQTFLESFPDMPVVILTGNEELELAQQAVQYGAQDLLVKGQINAHSLYRSMIYAVERKKTTRELQYMANHDTLTGLPNRRLLFERLKLEILHAKRDRNFIGVYLLDLDKFKLVNDNYGHDVGDLLLIETGKRIKTILRSSDTVSRLGGDEFVVLAPGCSQPEDLLPVADKILSCFHHPFVINGHEISITPSVGISCYPTDGIDGDGLLKQADDALYTAKEDGRNNYKLSKGDLANQNPHTPDLHDSTQQVGPS